MEYNVIFDISILAFIFLSAILAFSRGFFQEFLSLVSWLGAIILSYYFSKYFVDILEGMIGNLIISKIVSYVLVFILCVFTLSYFTSIFSSKIKNSAVGMIDRSLGFFFGIIRGYILLCMGLFAFYFFFNQNHPSWLEKSKMNDLLIQGLVQIVPIFDSENDSIIFLEEKIKKKSKDLFEKSINSHLRREKNRSNLEGYGKDERNNLETLIENFDNE